MASTLTRLTFVVTKEVEALLANAKKNHFYNRTQSDMIRQLIQAGLDTLDEKPAKEKQPARAG